MQTLNRLQVVVARLDLQLPPHLGPEDRLRLHPPRARLRLIKVEQYRHLLEVLQDRRLLPEAVQDLRLHGDHPIGSSRSEASSRSCA